MGREHLLHAAGHDIKLRRRRVALSDGVGNTLRLPRNLVQGRGQRQRLAADFRRRAVCAKFAGAAYRHLHDHRRKGSDKHRQYPCHAAIVAKEQTEIGEHRHRAGNRCHHCHDERIAVLHMAKLMRHHAFNFFIAEHIEQARRRRDGRMFGIAARCKGIGLCLIDNIDFGHRQSGTLRQALHHVVEFRMAACIHLNRLMHFQDDFIGIPIGKQVHPRRDQKRQYRPARATERIAHNHEQGRKGRQQHCGLKRIHRVTRLL